MLCKQVRIGFFVLFLLVFAWTSAFGADGAAARAQSSEPLKILGIGNSFTRDAMEHLYQIAQDAGVDVILGYLYIGGSSLAQHWENARLNLPRYEYYKNVDGTWRAQNNRTLLFGLRDEAWDLITLQQVSELSGVSASYTENDVLQNLIDYVNANKTNPEVKLGWHLTWAYQAGSTHSGFATYQRNQHVMFASIVNAVRKHIVTNQAFDLIIPAGTAVQNVRTSFIGDTLTRDGYHLSLNLGRYIAGLTWLRAITGVPLDDLTWVPSSYEVPAEYLPVIKEAVAAAVANPFAITISSYVEPPPGWTGLTAAVADAIDLNEYTLLDWEPVGCAYWNSNHATQFNVLISRANSTAANLCYFVSSGRMFTREELPVGTIIEIDPGYQYRPEGWTSLAARTTSRPGPVTTQRVIVTEEWWGRFQYRAFNVSHVGSTYDIRNEVEETAAKFRIYVPKQDGLQ